MITYKDYIDIISLEDIKKHYENENLSIKEACQYFNVSQAIFIRLLKYYNFHKSKDAHTKQIKRSKLEKYGDENYNNQEKRALTNIDKYGVDNQFKRVDMMETIRLENIKKYGSKNNIYKNIETKRKNNSYKQQVEHIRETVKEKYGVDWASKADIVKEHIRESLKETFNDKYGCDNYWLTAEAKRSNGSKNSKANLAFEQLLIDNNINYEKEFLLENRYYDFKVNNILIEINPTATHNSTWTPWNNSQGIDKHYHADKTDIAKNNGFRCIHIWDWDNQNLIINTFLKEKPQLGARLCNIKEVPIDEEIEFLNNNHLQGYVKSEKAFGLYHGEELVMIMTFGHPRYSKKYQWELLRLCSSKKIIGGSERLFKYFIKNNNPESVVSYCDRSKFNGDVYKKLGFKKKGRAISRHWYNIKLQDHITDKLLFKRGFDALLGSTFGYYGKGSSNEELMITHQFVEVYDAGQETFEWVMNN